MLSFCQFFATHFKYFSDVKITYILWAREMAWWLKSCIALAQYLSLIPSICVRRFILQLHIILVSGTLTSFSVLWESYFILNSHINFSNFMRYVLHIVKYVHSIYKVECLMLLGTIIPSLFFLSFYQVHSHASQPVSSPGCFQLIYFLFLYLPSGLGT